jgi:hypothetical protein
MLAMLEYPEDDRLAESCLECVDRRLDQFFDFAGQIGNVANFLQDFWLSIAKERQKTIFELANFKEQRSITASLVQEAARTFVEANEHFATLWGYVETDRRRFLISLIRFTRSLS